jgi:LemA protein
MQQPQRPSPKRFSDAQAREIYERAAQIESKTLFGADDESLSREELENAANRAGISDRAVEAAIAQLERERVQAQQVAVQKGQTRRTLVVAGVGVSLILAGSALLSQSALSSRLALAEEAKANVEVTLQRRQDLVPNALALAKANLGNESALIGALSRPSVDSATLESVRDKLEAHGVQTGALDELAGSENRITVARRRFNEYASNYNRTASSFPASLWRGAFGFPSKVEVFQAEAAAKEAPKF